MKYTVKIIDNNKQKVLATANTYRHSTPSIIDTIKNQLMLNSVAVAVKKTLRTNGQIKILITGYDWPKTFGWPK
jgi:hypothetical protein